MTKKDLPKDFAKKFFGIFLLFGSLESKCKPREFKVPSKPPRNGFSIRFQYTMTPKRVRTSAGLGPWLPDNLFLSRIDVTDYPVPPFMVTYCQTKRAPPTGRALLFSKHSPTCWGGYQSIPIPQFHKRNESYPEAGSVKRAARARISV